VCSGLQSSIRISPSGGGMAVEPPDPLHMSYFENRSFRLHEWPSWCFFAFAHSHAFGLTTRKRYPALACDPWTLTVAEMADISPTSLLRHFTSVYVSRNPKCFMVGWGVTRTAAEQFTFDMVYYI